MRVGMLGTGVVGQTVASKLVALGHDVRMGSRTAGKDAAKAWVASAGARGSEGTFADAAVFGELIVNATSGGASLAVLELVGAANLSGKVLVDIANPLDFTGGFPPRLSVCNDDSLGEQIQRSYPGARVVKTLNTVNADVMVDPAVVPGGHAMFLCGNDAAAKVEVSRLLESFGWPSADLMDLGDITNARGMEAYLLLWVRVFGATGDGHFNVKVQRA